MISGWMQVLVAFNLNHVKWWVILDYQLDYGDIFTIMHSLSIVDFWNKKYELIN